MLGRISLYRPAVPKRRKVLNFEFKTMPAPAFRSIYPLMRSIANPVAMLGTEEIIETSSFRPSTLTLNSSAAKLASSAPGRISTTQSVSAIELAGSKNEMMIIIDARMYCFFMS